MPLIEKDDVDMSYRRGYENGAVETFHAVEKFLNPAMQEAVRAWIKQDVHGWRREATLGHPPMWRLRVQ
jgi:hypothetical protein